jgi:uncharacterized protein (DUF924 family)
MNSEDILAFWFDPVTARKWFASDPEFDQQISIRFGSLLETASRDGCAEWEETARSALALVILLDQFSRNIYRGSMRAFAQDSRAREVTRKAIEHGFDLMLSSEERRWFYMPFMHSENIEDQKLSLQYFTERAPDTGAGEYARHHHDVIARFGRFPHRNVVLLRSSTASEVEYLKTATAWGQKSS